MTNIIVDMKKLVLSLSIIVFLFAPVSSAEVLQKLSGLAVSVDLQSQKLSVRFEHPVTGERILKIFSVLPSTGFKNVKRLDQIKPNDPVSIDYQEREKEGLQAVYIEVISLKGLPFDPDQVKKKFFAR